MFSWTEKALDTSNTQLAHYVIYELQRISVPTSPCSLRHAGSNASTGGWPVWIIYPCWENYSAELAAACNERHKEWACGVSMRVPAGRSLGHGSLLYSQVLHWTMNTRVKCLYSTKKPINWLIGHCQSSYFTWKLCPTQLGPIDKPSSCLRGKWTEPSLQNLIFK